MTLRFYLFMAILPFPAGATCVLLKQTKEKETKERQNMFIDQIKLNMITIVVVIIVEANMLMKCMCNHARYYILFIRQERHRSMKRSYVIDRIQL